MIYDVTTTEQAEADLRGIYEHIAFELLAPESAAGQLDRLEEHIMELEQFPEKLENMKKNHGVAKGLHVMPVDNYLVFYILEKESELVTVIRVMFAGRDVDNQLSNHTSV